MENKSTSIYLSLGSNRGDRCAHLVEAIGFLSGVGVVKAQSRCFQTEPVGMAPGTESFYNMALRLDTTLSPLELLKQIKGFEQSKGRDLNHSHYQPRTIDIDILMVVRPQAPQGVVLKTRELQIPHKEMAKRAFVLVPLAEIAPDVYHPLLNKSISQLLAEITITDGLIAPLTGDPDDN